MLLPMAIIRTTLFIIWWDYTEGSGANGVANLYINTSGTKPAATLSIANGDGVGDVNSIYLMHPWITADPDLYFDQVLIDESDIGDPPA